MEVAVTTVRPPDQNGSSLRAYCTLVLDNELVLQDVKLIAGNSGLFVCMPAKKVTEKCGQCGAKNPLLANYCSTCGHKFAAPSDRSSKLFFDVVYPINAECRKKITEAVLGAYNKELG